MNMFKSYTVSPEVEAEVKKIMAEGDEKYALIKDVMCVANFSDEDYAKYVQPLIDEADEMIATMEEQVDSPDLKSGA